MLIQTKNTDRATLSAIARQAMMERGLEPDFPPAALLLSGRNGEQFNAIVTGASPKGTWVRLLQPPAEGRLERGFQGLDVGDHVHVKLVHTDVERGFIDFVRD